MGIGIPLIKSLIEGEVDTDVGTLLGDVSTALPIKVLCNGINVKGKEKRYYHYAAIRRVICMG